MAATNPTATELRQAGNALYKESKFTHAARKYEKALMIDPADNASRRNLSAAQYELGKYSQAIDVIDEAHRKEKDVNKRSALLIRKAKCLIHLGRVKEAKETLNRYEGTDGEFWGKDEGVCQMRLLMGEAVKDEDRKRTFKQVTRLPMLRQNLIPDPYIEYFTRGHDESTAAFNMERLISLSETGPLELAVFYAGVGDARHVYQQLNHIHAYRKALGDKRKPGDNCVLTLLDHKSHVIARNITVFRALHDAMDTEDEKEKELIMAMAAYIYISDIMPGYLRDRFTEMLKGMLIVDGEGFGVPWLRCDFKTAETVRDIYRYWIADEFRHRFDVTHAQNHLIHRDNPEICEVQFPGMGLKDEWEQACVSRLVYPPLKIIKDHEPALLNLIKSNKEKARGVREIAFQKYAKKHWRTNVTLLQEREWYLEYGRQWAFSEDPLNLIRDLLIGNPSNYKTPEGRIHVIDLALEFFSACAEALVEDIVVEFKIDDVYHQLDCIRYGIAESRDGLPTKYNAIFLSNIPDYTGGHLSMVLHALPLLKPTSSPESFVQSNILANPANFTTGLKGTLAEYLLLPNMAYATHTLGLTMLGPSSSTQAMMNLPPFLILTEPHQWGISVPKTLISKPEFTRWLTQMFFKLALPVPRDLDAEHNNLYRMHQPQTLHQFVRLCIYLVEESNIPKHWVVNLLEAILTGKVSTSATPPVQTPVPFEALKPTPSKMWYVDTFVPELRMLLAYYQPVLPFHILTTLTPLRKYEISFPKIWMDVTRIPPIMNVLALMFVNPEVEAIEMEQVFEDFIAYRGEHMQGLMVLMSTFEWHQRGKNFVATWLMESDSVEEMKIGDWKVGVMRTDSWVPIGQPGEEGMLVDVKRAVELE